MVLSSLDAGLIVVRHNWEVAGWNRVCEELWGVREEEVLGQSLFALDTGLPFEEFRESIAVGMQGRTIPQPVQVNAVNRRGRPIHCRVRIHPLLDGGNSPVGALLLIETQAAQGG